MILFRIRFDSKSEFLCFLSSLFCFVFVISVRLLLTFFCLFLLGMVTVCLSCVYFCSFFFFVFISCRNLNNCCDKTMEPFFFEWIINLMLICDFWYFISCCKYDFECVLSGYEHDQQKTTNSLLLILTTCQEIVYRKKFSRQKQRRNTR